MIGRWGRAMAALALLGGASADRLPDPPGALGPAAAGSEAARAADALAEGYLRAPLEIASRRHVEVEPRMAWVAVTKLMASDRAFRGLSPVRAEWDDPGVSLVKLWQGRDRGVAVAMAEAGGARVVGIYEVRGALPDGMRRADDGAPGR